MTITKLVFKNYIIATAALPALLAGSACYQYQTSTLTSVLPGQVVHVELTEPGATGLAATIGPRATSIDGRVLSRDDTKIVLAATQIARSVGPEEFLRDEPIALPLLSAERVTTRTFDRPRSILATGGILFAAIIAAAIADQAPIFSAKGPPSSSSR
jgi:hypothetical protein